MSQPLSSVSRRPENLAQIFQELLTAIERLRSNRQTVNDAQLFRRQILDSTKAAVQRARTYAGYATEDIRMATLAVIGMLDETILNFQNPVFGDWSRQPLQEELFGAHTAGEVFFENLRALLNRENSADLADVLEVHYLCLLLRYRGRYSLGGAGDLQAVMAATARKIRHIRGGFSGLAPAFNPQAEPVKQERDPWPPRFVAFAVVCLVLAILSFVVYNLVLDSRASSIVSGA
jgi:type VI secretion system protein ImpK